MDNIRIEAEKATRYLVLVSSWKSKEERQQCIIQNTTHQSDSIMESTFKYHYRAGAHTQKEGKGREKAKHSRIVVPPKYRVKGSASTLYLHLIFLNRLLLLPLALLLSFTNIIYLFIRSLLRQDLFRIDVI